MEIPDNSTPLTEFEHIGSLNFIRERMGSLMNENDVLRQRIIDMEVSMAMVQTAFVFSSFFFIITGNLGMFLK